MLAGGSRLRVLRAERVPRSNEHTLHHHQQRHDQPSQQNSVPSEWREQYHQRGDRAEQSRPTVLGPVVQKSYAQQVNRDGNRHGRPGADLADLRAARRVIHGDSQAPSHGGNGREDQVVPVPPDERLPRVGEPAMFEARTPNVAIVGGYVVMRLALVAQWRRTR
jgi:hypothetical protein